jgi:hypothetical protein
LHAHLHEHERSNINNDELLGTIWGHTWVKKRKRDEGGEGKNLLSFIKMDLKVSFYNMYKIGNAKFVYCTNVV